MDPQVQASFIPKKSLEVSRGAGSSRFGLFFLVGLLIFIASLIAAGSAFLYQQYLQTALSSKSKSLALSEGAYDPSVINDLMRLDTRINQSRLLLSKHAAPSALFDFLSAQTLQNVSFKDFSYVLNSDGSATIGMTGNADSFATVALQSDQFGASKSLKNVVFSNIAVGDKGGINFAVSATVIPDLLLYKNSFNNAGTVVPTTVPTNTPSGTTTPH